MSNISNSKNILHSEFVSWWELPEESNVSDYILRKCEELAKCGRQICIKNISTGETLLYSDISKISARIASKLFKLGVRKGDTVIYSTHDPAKVHVFMLGVWRANGIVRSCYPEEIGDSLVRRIKESKARFIACDESVVHEYRQAANSITDWSVNVIVFGEPSITEGCLYIHDFYEDDGSSCPTTSTTFQDIALILPTSGTTGEIKGAIYTHKILLENILAHENMPFTDRDEEPTMITSRQTHYVGSVTLLSCITKGRLLLAMPKVTIKGLLEAVQSFKVRALIAFPAYITGMVNHTDVGNFDLSSLHFITVAGQVIVPETMAVIKRLPNLKTFVNLYGMTEAGLLVTTADWASMKQGVSSALHCKDYSVGKLPPNTSLQVLDLDTEEAVGPSFRGELCFKSVVTTAGYLFRPEEEAKTYKNGWVKTGDIGYYDNDGFIYVVDRAKEVFKWNNDHISPSEIENVLLRHPSVGQAAVIGVPGTNAEGSCLGHIPRAFVVLKKEELVTENELITFAQNNLPPYMHLKGGLFIIPEMPLGKTGKVAKALLCGLELPVQNHKAQTF